MEITPPEDREICRSIDFAPRGPRDCPRAKPEGNLEGRGGGFRFNTVRLHCLGVVVGVVGLMGEVEVVRGKLKGNLEGEG